MANIFKKILIPLSFVLLLLVAWKILLYGYSPILSFSFWLDDWPLIWGVSQEPSVFFNPAKTIWHFAQERFAVREGYLQVWSAAYLYNKYGLNPYYYHLYGFIAKMISIAALAWAGWMLTKKIYIGIIAGLIFASAFMGAETLWWFNVNANFFFIAILLFLLPLFVKGIKGNTKLFVLSLMLATLAIYLYPPRAHVLLGLPIVALIWSEKLLDKELLVKITVFIVVIFFSFNIFFAEAGTGQVSRAIFHRLYVFSKSGLAEGKRVFLTYPFVALGFSILPLKTIDILTNIPRGEFLLFGKFPVTHFRVWNFAIFPVIWVFLISIFFSISGKVQQKKLKAWLAIGVLFFLFNTFLRRTIFTGQEWQWRNFFLYEFSAFIILISFAALNFLKNDKGYGLLAKLLPSALFLGLISFVVVWFFDPLIPPDSPSISRYLTIPTVFGSLFISVVFGWVITASEKLKKSFFVIKPFVVKIAAAGFIFYLTFLIIFANLEKARKYIGQTLLSARSHENVSRILNKISEDVEFGTPPPIILADSWDYGEVYPILIYTGHALAVWNNISDINQFPIIYFDEEKLVSEFENLCVTRKIDENKIYRFKITNDKAVNISGQLPKLTCPKNSKL